MTDLQNAIQIARAQVSDICVGRPCLSECLERIGRVGAVPPPCGGVRSRRARFFLPYLGAVILAALIVLALSSFGATCTWNGTGYTCDGGGSILVVNGGGGDVSGGPVVITNMVGTCTNCIAMSPDQMRTFKQQANEIWTDLDIDANLIAQEYAPAAIAILSPYAVKYPLSGISYSGTSMQIRPPINQVTNFVEHTPGVKGSKPFLAAQSVTGYIYPSLKSPMNAAATFIGAYDGAAAAYNEVADSVKEATNTILNIQQSAQLVSQRGYQLHTMIESLSEDACTAQYNGPATGGSGSGIVTNQATGDWCTFEQGGMIIDTLQSIDAWFHEQENYLKSITNWVSAVNYTIIANLNSQYTHIPSADNLGQTWQDLYLDGQRTQWGYEPTNILARIELLLYGISGVGTNSLDNSELETDGESDGEDERDALESITSDASDEKPKSLGTALTSFFGVFTSIAEGDEYRGGETVIEDTVLYVGQENYTLPALRLGSSQDSNGRSVISTVRTLGRAFFTCLYFVGGAFLIFRYWVWFAAWAVKLSRWAIDLLSSLFAD